MIFTSLAISQSIFEVALRSLIGFNDTDNMFFACPLNTNSNLSNSIYNEWPCKYLYHYLYTTEIFMEPQLFSINSQLNVLLLCGIIIIETQYYSIRVMSRGT